MWKHEIISDLKSLNLNIIPANYKYMVDEINSIITKIDTAQVFYFGNLSVAEKLMDKFENSTDKMKETYNYEYIKFPYNITLWEYVVDGDNGYGYINEKNALLITDNEKYIKINVLVFNQDRKIWLPSFASYKVFKTVNGQILISAPNDLNLTEKNEVIHMGNKTTSYCLTFNIILNCKNILTEEIHPPEKVNKKRLKNGKLPLYSYHVLNVVLGKNKSPSHNGSDSGIKQRLHFQRGHFKQFSDDKPLFGKVSGLYWWQPHLRGTNKDGFVDKEYNIIT